MLLVKLRLAHFAIPVSIKIIQIGLDAVGVGEVTGFFRLVASDDTVLIEVGAGPVLLEGAVGGKVLRAGDLTVVVLVKVTVPRIELLLELRVEQLVHLVVVHVPVAIQINLAEVLLGAGPVVLRRGTSGEAEEEKA